GDSGGPGFVAAGGRTYLAGISAWGDDRSGDGITGTYGDLEGYTRVSTYAGWIREVVGER
ncbi:MAG TPA: trypsin-like serine protease, partial [Longimicrobiaceae bacterium]